MFWYTPQAPVTPGRNIQLRVTVITDRNGSRRHFTNSLVVHAGEAPLPRFSDGWLYGDLHYHSQMTDNEGESAYSYRNVVRTLGAMGLDFVFATDHASDGEQVDGGIGVWRCGTLAGKECNPINAPFPCEGGCRLFQGTEARDLNAARFLAAKQILYGPDGANEAASKDAGTGGIATLRSRRLLPQVFLGEELDAWPEITSQEQGAGAMRFGDGLVYRWPLQPTCAAPAVMGDCAAMYVKPYLPNDHRTFGLLDDQGIPFEAILQSELGNTVGSVVNLLFAPDGPKPHNSRQHLLYLPFNAAPPPDQRGWVSGDTGPFGGGTRRLAEVIEDISAKGVAFLAHPVINQGPGGPGPDVVPYSRTALNRAWASQAVLGLQFWNEDSRRRSAPTAANPVWITNVGGRYDYTLPWNAASQLWTWRSDDRSEAIDGFARDLYHGAYTWDVYLRKGLTPAETAPLRWLARGEPRKWFMAGGSDAHGDFNYRLVVGLRRVETPQSGRDESAARRPPAARRAGEKNTWRRYCLAMNDVLALLLRNLDAAYSTRGWHGPSLRGSLRGVTAKEALRRPSKGRHNVWELTAHAAYWKYAVRNRLRKGKRGSFGMKGSNWFASPARADGDAWRALVQLLDDEHQLLRDAVASLSDAELHDTKTMRLVYGVAAHDVYHTGQIQLVKRLVRE